MKGFNMIHRRTIRGRAVRLVQHGYPNVGKWSLMLADDWVIPLDSPEWRHIRVIMRNLEKSVRNRDTHGTSPKYVFRNW